MARVDDLLTIEIIDRGGHRTRGTAFDLDMHEDMRTVLQRVVARLGIAEWPSTGVKQVIVKYEDGTDHTFTIIKREATS